MSAPAATSAVSPVGPGTLITIKIAYDDHIRRFKIPLRELTARAFPQKLRELLDIPKDVNVTFERYSDSAGSYVQLDSDNPAVFKQLYRAAKAKLKLRMRATVHQPASQPTAPESLGEQQGPARFSYLETVLSSPIPKPQDETNDSATSSSAALPKTSDKSTFPESDRVLWLNTAEPNPSRREFVLGPDNPSVLLPTHTSLTGVFCIDCNRCGRAIPNEHYHCDTCADGDYDLCPQCLDSGATCLSEDHWLVRRFVKDGIVTNSTTKTLASHKIQSQGEKPAPPQTSESVPDPVQELGDDNERICNCCLKELDEDKMVSCADCEDFDLCVTCVLGHKHGHHPSHTFVVLGDLDSGLKNLVLSRCKPGRGYLHAAICDGCEKHICGVRHKCLTCPDWDYCSECHLAASRTHPGHRFAPLYTAISEPLHSREMHFGVYCDGPLCKDKSGPIIGVRYKCSVCHDTDFCAKCEVHPTNAHNRTHPMVMFKTPVHNVTVSTIHDSAFDGTTTYLGDQTQRSASTQATAPIELETQSPEILDKEKTECVDESKSPDDEAITAPEGEPITPEPPANPEVGPEYQAFFVCDTVADGTAMPPNEVFQQTWTLYNPGPLAWPSGSSVRFVGGDSMFNLDTNHPTSLTSITAAMESNRLHEPLEPGQSANFTVTLKTPKRVGTAISYWRLKLANGTPFGHRLWCDVQVQNDVPVKDAAVTETQGNDLKVADASTANQSENSGSQMVFPKLDKESPEASTHEAAGARPAAPPAPSVSNPSEQDILDDVTSLTLDDGFWTDEEYDILDASDQEFMDANSTRNN